MDSADRRVLLKIRRRQRRRWSCLSAETTGVRDRRYVIVSAPRWAIARRVSAPGGAIRRQRWARACAASAVFARPRAKIASRVRARASRRPKYMYDRRTRTVRVCVRGAGRDERVFRPAQRSRPGATVARPVAAGGGGTPPTTGATPRIRRPSARHAVLPILKYFNNISSSSVVLTDGIPSAPNNYGFFDISILVRGWLK